MLCAGLWEMTMFDFGEYTFSVLGSYFAGVVLLGGLVVLSVARQRKLRAQIRALEKETS